MQRSGHGTPARGTEIHEHDKANEWAIGRTLTIHDMRFDDLDEVRSACALEIFPRVVPVLTNAAVCNVFGLRWAGARAIH